MTPVRKDKRESHDLTGDKGDVVSVFFILAKQIFFDEEQS